MDEALLPSLSTDCNHVLNLHQPWTYDCLVSREGSVVIDDSKSEA
jgi:hypothetical protein